MAHLLNGVVRKFVNGSFRIFESIPKVIDTDNLTEEYRQYIVEQSQEFREVLSVLNSDVNLVAETLDVSSSSSNDLDQEYDIVCNLQQLWHICEVFQLNPTKHISIEMAKWLKACVRQHYPFDLALERMRLTEQPELLKQSSAAELGGFNYWDVVYWMVAQGNNLQACEALAMHSELSAVLNSSHSGANGIERIHCQALFDTLLSHPYIQFVVGDGEQEATVLTSQQQQSMVSSFNDWAAKVKKLRASNNSLLLKIPQIDTILRILLGEVAALVQASVSLSGGETEGNQWVGVALGLLLYVYPPPLSRANLSQVVEEAVGLVTRAGIQQSASEVVYVNNLREAMNGNVGPLLKSMYEQGAHYAATTGRKEQEGSAAMDTSDSENSGMHSVRSDISLVSLLSVAHLATLLVHGADQTDLVLPIRSSKESEEDKPSFLEQMLLEAAQRLNTAEFNVTMIIAYLSSCPINGRDTARTLLTSRRIVTDEETIVVSDALHSLNWRFEAETVLIARAQYWLNMAHPVYLGDEYVKSLRSPHSDVLRDSLTPELLHTSTVAKAMFFLQLANYFSFMESLLERSLYRCMAAVATCKPLFTGLNMLPMAPVPRKSPEYRYEPSVPEKKTTRVFTADEERSLVIHLEVVLREAQELLETVTVSSSSAVFADQVECVSRLLQIRGVLETYVSAVNTRLFRANDLSAMFRAAEEVTALVNADKQYVPCRYHLHLLELSNWFATVVLDLKLHQHLNPEPSSSAIDAAAWSPECGRLPETQSYVYSKEDAHGLIATLSRVVASRGFKRFLAGSGGNAADLEALRLALLNLLATSLAQDNANSHANRVFIDKMYGGVGNPVLNTKTDSLMSYRIPKSLNTHSFAGPAAQTMAEDKPADFMKEMEIADFLTAARKPYFYKDKKYFNVAHD